VGAVAHSLASRAPAGEPHRQRLRRAAPPAGSWASPPVFLSHTGSRSADDGPWKSRYGMPTSVASWIRNASTNSSMRLAVWSRTLARASRCMHGQNPFSNALVAAYTAASASAGLALATSGRVSVGSVPGKSRIDRRSRPWHDLRHGAAEHNTRALTTPRRPRRGETRVRSGDRHAGRHHPRRRACHCPRWSRRDGRRSRRSNTGLNRGRGSTSCCPRWPTACASPRLPQ
jgi:hypothetical protein